MEEKEISLKDLALYVWSKKIIILIISLSLSIVGVAGLYIYNANFTNRSLTLQVELDWLNISSNKYPDNTIFDFEDDILSDEVISNVSIEGFTTEELLTLVENNVIKSYEVEEVDDVDVTKTTSSYKITFNHFSRSISITEGTNILLAIKESYEEYINTTKSSKIILDDLSGIDLDNSLYDYYYDIHNLKTSLSTLMSTVNGYKSSRINYLSKDNKRFNDVLTELETYEFTLLLLEDELVNNPYSKDTVKTKEKIDTYLDVVNNQLTIKEDRVTEYDTLITNAQGNLTESFLREVEYLYRAVANLKELQTILVSYQTSLTNNGDVGIDTTSGLGLTFKNNLDALVTNITNSKIEVLEMIRESNTEYTNIDYLDRYSPVSIEGGISFTIGAIAIIILSFSGVTGITLFTYKEKDAK